MPFRDPIVAGTTLVRQAIHSPNYRAGLAGWTINADGTAEFADLAVRGSFSSAVPPQVPRIEITAADPAHGILGGDFLMYSDDPAEVAPGQLTYSTGDLVLSTSEVAAGRVALLVLQHPDVGVLGGLALSVQGGSGPPLVTLGDAENAEVHCGTVLAPTMRAQASPVGGAVGTASAPFVALGATSVTGTYPPSGVLALNWGASMSNNAATGYACMGVEIRDNNAGGTPRLAASTAIAALHQGAFGLAGCSFAHVVTGLPTSGTFFARPMYCAITAGTATFDRNFLVVTPQP